MRRPDTRMDTLRETWTKLLECPFPADCAGEEPLGVDLVSLDSFAAGCLDTFFRGRRPSLDKERIDILRECARDLDKVTRCLDGDAQSYFRRLKTLVEGVLRILDERP